jgi:hypothetical protein
MCGDKENVIPKQSYLVVDEKTYPHLHYLACLLASYRARTSGLLDEEQTHRVLEDVYVSVGRISPGLYTIAMFTFRKEPFLAITSEGKRQAVEQYGEARMFKFGESENFFTMMMTKCFFTISSGPQLLSS